MTPDLVAAVEELLWAAVARLREHIVAADTRRSMRGCEAAIRVYCA